MIFTVQRRALVDLRNGRWISSDVMRRVEREIGLEESGQEVGGCGSVGVARIHATGGDGAHRATDRVDRHLARAGE